MDAVVLSVTTKSDYYIETKKLSYRRETASQLRPSF